MPRICIPLLEKNIEVPEGTALTELDGILTFGCRLGACGACAIQVIAGGEHLNPMQYDEEEFLTVLGFDTDSHRLACQCLVSGDITIKPC